MTEPSDDLDTPDPRTLADLRGVEPMSPATRGRHLAVALEEYDRLQAEGAGGERVVPFRRRTPRVLATAAAVAAVLVGVGLAASLQGGDADQQADTAVSERSGSGAAETEAAGVQSGDAGDASKGADAAARSAEDAQTDRSGADESTQSTRAPAMADPNTAPAGAADAVDGPGGLVALETLGPPWCDWWDWVVCRP